MVAEDAAAVAVLPVVGEVADEALGEGVVEGQAEIVPPGTGGASAVHDDDAHGFLF